MESLDRGNSRGNGHRCIKGQASIQEPGEVRGGWVAGCIGNNGGAGSRERVDALGGK